jgi:AraC-like DNA-binding protein
MRPGGRYEATHDPLHPLTVSYLHFELTHRPRSFRPPFEVLRTADPVFVEAVVQRVIRLRATGSSAAQLSAAALLGSLLGELEREALAEGPSSAAGGIVRHRREVIEQLAAEIRENVGHPPTIAELARRAGYSVDHFSRIFAQVVGSRPQQFIIARRLTRACELLAQTGLTITQIAETLGYADVFFFSRQFRRHVGLTPSRYRASLVDRVPAKAE